MDEQELEDLELDPEEYDLEESEVMTDEDFLDLINSDVGDYDNLEEDLYL